MKLVIQRVKNAEVVIDSETVSSIGKGLLVFLGVGQGDTEEMIDKYVDKLIKLRIFEDDMGKTNLSVYDVKGQIMVVSQFTLYADCKKGNRPSFIMAEEPGRAEQLYEYFIAKVKEKYGEAYSGSFGADMKIKLTNDGPFTILWDSRDW